MANRDIKLAAAGAGVRIWQIADELRIPDYTLSRKLRHELPADEKENLFEIIKRLSAEGMGGRTDGETQQI